MRTLIAATLALCTLAPAVASACGGFFCSATPVDQAAERIIFVDNNDGSWTSYVEITYQGEPEGFAWIVPVPEAPALDTWFSGGFNALDLATQPQFQINDGCAFAVADADGGGGNAPPPGGEVQVLAQERVGPFETATVKSEDPRALIDWLRRNGYRVVAPMEPFIELYTREDMAFLAMKLAPGEDTDAIEPIKMTYNTAAPMVPLRLTSIAAQLEMGVKVWVLSDQRFGPLNVPSLAIDDADLVFDPLRWETNYPTLVARAIDAAGGHGFVTENATKTEQLAQTVRDSFVPERFGQEALDARDALADLLESKPYLTRMYARLSPEEMDIDPIFVPVEGGDVSRMHVVPESEEGAACDFDEAGDAACDFTTCGAAGRCAVVATGGQGQGRVAGCACAEGTLARAAFDASSRTGVSVACGDARMNFVTAANDDPLAFADPCANNPCGDNGECVSLNGFPTCRCDVGFVAIPMREGATMVAATCVEPMDSVVALIADVEVREPNLPYPGRVTPFDPSSPATPQMPQMPEQPEGQAPAGVRGVSAGDGGCAIDRTAHRGPWWLLLALLPLGIRRRRA